ncbi:hypothetical protein D3C81_751980 [compost metagenome]
MSKGAEQGADQADQQHGGHYLVHAEQLLGADHQAGDATVRGHEVFGTDGAQPGVDQRQAQAGKNGRGCAGQHQQAQALPQVQAQGARGFTQLRREAGDTALGGDQQREERSHADEYLLGPFTQAEPGCEQRHPGKQCHLTQGRQAGPEDTFGIGRKPQQQTDQQASATAQQQAGQSALQAQQQGLRQRTIGQAGQQGAQHFKWRGQDVAVDPAKAAAGLPQGQQCQWQQQALPTPRHGATVLLPCGRLRPVQQALFQGREAALQQCADQADH